MIDLPYFGPREPEAARILATVSAMLGSITGRDCQVRLLSRLDDERRARIMALNDAVFGDTRDVFDTRALDEVAADPDAILLTVEIDGVVEAFVFGYYEDPPGQLVEGTDFYLDSGLVAPKWQDHGIADVTGAGLLLLLALIRDVHDIGISVWSGGQVDRLVRYYREAGFVDAVGHGVPPPWMRLRLDESRVATLAGLLGLAPPTELSSR
jgi:GNAT superfamily N-acetyltransferase